MALIQALNPNSTFSNQFNWTLTGVNVPLEACEDVGPHPAKISASSPAPTIPAPKVALPFKNDRRDNDPVEKLNGAWLSDASIYFTERFSFLCLGLITLVNLRKRRRIISCANRLSILYY